MSRILAVCCSTNQLFFVVNLCHTIYKNDEVDVIIADTLSNAEKLIVNANKQKIFNNAYFAQCAEQSMKERKLKGIGNIKRLFGRGRILPKFINDKQYDIFLFNSTNPLTQALYEYLYRKNKKMRVGFIEDGFSTYCFQGTELLNNIKRNNAFKRKIIYKLIGVRLLVNNIDFQLMYTPDAALWEAPFERIKVNKINMYDSDIKNALNNLYDYTSMSDTYDKPIIFFEESYRAENIEIGDVDIVEKIAQWVGKENIMVKIHPRNKCNVFKELGYKTNENIEIPWEIIFMNQKAMKDKILVSIASGCLATPYTVMGEEVTAISLLNMDCVKPTNFLPEYYEYFRQHVYLKRPDLFFQPHTDDELKEILFNKLSS